MPSRQNQYQLSVSVDGVSLGVWENSTGGESDSNSTQHYLGGMGPQISLGGQQTVTNLVVSKLEDLDILTRDKWLRGRTGKGQVTVGRQRLDDEGVAIGEPVIYRGILKRAKGADVDAQGSNAAMYELEIDVAGQVA